MTHRWLEVKLQSDAIFTASSATVGQPASLDYLPGATLLGAAAQRCYAQLGDAAFGVFHMGAVRFGDGRPLHPSYGVALPTPLSWHTLKYGRGSFDLSQVERPSEQVQQLRGAWVLPGSEGWLRWSLGRKASMRTAITEGGRAREGLLYGFEAVPAGTTYLVELSGHDEASLDHVSQALCQAPIRVGRSRSAEFGEAQVSIRAHAPEDNAPSTPANPDTLRVLCLGDLALMDASTGMPRLLPHPSDFGLVAGDGGWVLDPSRTFLRFRSYSPYNGKRRRPDMERQVIVSGSVITFKRSGDAPPADLPALRAALASGVGEYRSSGLGSVLVEPRVLADRHPEVVPLQPGPPAQHAEAPDDPLINWLRARQDEASAFDAAWDFADRKAREAAGWGIPRAQWGRIRALAADARYLGRSVKSVQDDLKSQVSEGVAADIWGKKHSKELIQWFEKLPKNIHRVRVLELLGRRVPRHQAKVEEAPHA